MRYSSITKYLKAHSIHRSRISTINGTFAVAVLPVEAYDAAKVIEAMRILGQAQPEGELTCIYCEKRPAESWDHLVSVVKNKLPHGPGHQIGNLVPSCGPCNSKKGGGDWEAFVKAGAAEGEDRTELVARIRAFQRACLAFPDHQHDALDPDVQQLEAIRARIEALMHEADVVAARIRQRKAAGAVSPTPSAQTASS